MKRLASILIFLMLMMGCDFHDPGMPEALKKKEPPPRFECPDGWVPGDLPACGRMDISDMLMVPEANSRTIACKILPNAVTSQGEHVLGSVNRDGTIHWWWNARYLNPRMQDKFTQACWSQWPLSTQI